MALQEPRPAQRMKSHSLEEGECVAEQQPMIMERIDALEYKIGEAINVFNGLRHRLECVCSRDYSIKEKSQEDAMVSTHSDVYQKLDSFGDQIETLIAQIHDVRNRLEV